MSTTSTTNKTLAVIGSGANMATGNLIYKLGGIELPMLSKLQEKGINSYDRAAQELKDTNEELYFYTPQHRVTVKVSSTDGLLLVVTPPPQTSETLFTESIIDQLKKLAPFFAHQKAIIVITLPENQTWSESVYNDLVENLRAELRDLGISIENTPIIPSNIQGENFIESSSNTPWHNKSTLVTELNGIFT